MPFRYPGGGCPALSGMWIWFFGGRSGVGKCLESPTYCAGMCGMRREMLAMASVLGRTSS